VGDRITGFFVGIGVGVFVGGLAGLAIECDDCSVKERLGLTIFFAGIGGVIGGPAAAIFVVHYDITINGQYGKYEEFKNELEKKKIKSKRRK
jgi:hypothetical protein